ncbi:MAG: lytic transglycosylase [Hyphomicrobiales bacterium]|nr:MAG: lytic transglycosylase [Hyphomicrobiales bacterium]
MKIKQSSKLLRAGAVALIIGLSLTLSQTPSYAEAGFQKWVNGFYSVARKNGINKSTYQRAFKGITSADPEILELTRHQPEFKQKMWMYFDSRVNENSLERGQEMKQTWDRWLTAIEKKYGVSRHILLAIWSMETSYGKALENPKALRSVVRSLATLAYRDKRRRKFARTQLIAALKILQSGKISTQHLRGSWAGAMGHTQFIPTSYRAYGQDMDGDGRRDIWTSIPDALATAANLLRRNGWRTGQTWGYEVKVSARAAKQSGKTKTIAQWEKLGIRRAKGKVFKYKNLRAALKFPAGRSGPAFLMLKNFYVIKRYNNSDKYALAVGHLADQIAGYGGFEKPLPRPYRRLVEDERLALQKQLSRIGLYSGKIDGKIGSGTRVAIRRAQDRLGMTPDGYESPKLLKRLQQIN